MGFELSPTTSGDTSPPPAVQTPENQEASITSSRYTPAGGPTAHLGASLPLFLSLVFLLYISPLLTINYFFLLRQFRLGHHWGKGLASRMRSLLDQP